MFLRKGATDLSGNLNFTVEDASIAEHFRTSISEYVIDEIIKALSQKEEVAIVVINQMMTALEQ